MKTPSMVGPRRFLWLGIVALLGLGATRPAPAVAAPGDERPAVEFEEGALAPAHGWLQDDGCSARTGASAARALRGAVERAWKYSVKEGAIEGEPLAWKDRVFVVERAGKRRVIHVLSMTTGAARSTWAVESGAPLFPSVGEGRIVVKSSPTTVEALSVGDAALNRRWKITAKEGIGAATLLRDEVYVVRDGVLERWAYGAAVPTWPKNADKSDGIKIERDATTPPRFPRPSVRGGSVFVTSGTDVVEVDRATGHEKGRGSFGSAVDPDTSRTIVTSGDVLVMRGGTAAAGAIDTYRFSRPSPGSLEASGSLSMPCGLAAVGRQWAGVIEEDGVRSLCGSRPGAEDDAYVFAGKGIHDEFVAAMPPTYAPGVVYVGLRAFAVPSLAVLRSPATAVLSRAIPVRDRLLVVENATTVSAWREVRVGDDKPLIQPAGAPAASTVIAMKGCRAALDDGRVLEGPFTYDVRLKVFRSSKPGELASCPARAVNAVVTSDAPRKIVFAFRSVEAAAGVVSILRSETARDLLALVPSAVAAGDAELARRILGSAVEHGAPDADVGAADAAVAALEASPKPRDDAKADEIVARLEALGHKEADALVEMADAMGKDAPAEVRVALVRAAVERDPAHEGATKWVRARLPKELPLVEPLQLDDWLDFVEVRGRLKVRVWGMSKDNQHVWGSDEDKPSDESPLFKAFWSARSTWPGEVDMVAFECGPLVVFSPLERPGAIVRCLALGRLVSETLDKVFLPIAPPRKGAEALILQLYSNRKHYLEASRPSGSSSNEAEREDGLENTAGHYSPGDNVTRMFFPDDGEDSFSVSGVYAHELTHHWIERRRPTPSGERLKHDSEPTTPGYWVVEGIADFMMGFVYDVEGQRATAENPRAEYADCLSGIATEGLIPWASHLTMTQEDFTKLSMGDRIPVPRRWRLGPTGSTVPKVLFYDQGAAVCAYLYLAEGQKHRKALLDFIYAYYEGRAKADTLQKSTGYTPEELGKRVVAWCREVVKKG